MKSRRIIVEPRSKPAGYKPRKHKLIDPPEIDITVKCRCVDGRDVQMHNASWRVFLPNKTALKHLIKSLNKALMECDGMLIEDPMAVLKAS